MHEHVQDTHRRCGVVTGQTALQFTPGGAIEFIDDLWALAPADTGGRLVGVLHQVGDRGQILVRLTTAGQQDLELVVLPGQVLVTPDLKDPATWTVQDGPAPLRLNLP